MKAIKIIEYDIHSRHSAYAGFLVQNLLYENRYLTVNRIYNAMLIIQILKCDHQQLPFFDEYKDDFFHKDISQRMKEEKETLKRSRRLRNQHFSPLHLFKPKHFSTTEEKTRFQIDVHSVSSKKEIEKYILSCNNGCFTIMSLFENALLICDILQKDRLNEDFEEADWNTFWNETFLNQTKEDRLDKLQTEAVNRWNKAHDTQLIEK